MFLRPRHSLSRRPSQPLRRPESGGYEHQLRHSSLTLLADAGVPEDVRQRQAGHATVAMALKYTTGAEAQGREAADALNAALTKAK